MAEQAENQTSAGQPDGGFRGRVLAAIAEPRHEVLCINALTARVEQGSFTADEAREMRTLVLEQVRAATKQRTKRAWAMLYAVLERADLKAIGDLLRQAPPSGVTHNTQVNIDARGGPAEMFRSLIDEVRSLDTSRVTSTVDRHDVPAEHPVKAPAEPAGDNQP